MNKTEAENITRTMGDFWRAEMHRTKRPDSHHVVARIEEATYSAARDLLPDTASAALLEEDGNPFVVAVDGQQVYVLTLDDMQDVDLEKTVQVRSMHIDPLSATVRLESKLRERMSHDEPVLRSDKWSFTLPDGDELVIETRFRPGGNLDPRETVALKLATAVGWNVPNAVREPLVAVA